MNSFINNIQQQQQQEQEQNKINVSNDNYYYNKFRVNTEGKSTPWFNKRILSKLTHDKVNVPNVKDDTYIKKALFQVKFKDNAFEKMRNPTSNIGLHGSCYVNPYLSEQTTGQYDCFPQAISWLIQNIEGTNIRDSDIAHEFGSYALNRTRLKSNSNPIILYTYFPYYKFYIEGIYAENFSKIMKTFSEILPGHATLITLYNDTTGHSHIAIIYRDKYEKFGVFERQYVQNNRLSTSISNMNEEQYIEYINSSEFSTIFFYRVKLSNTQTGGIKQYKKRNNRNKKIKKTKRQNISKTKTRRKKGKKGKRTRKH